MHITQSKNYIVGNPPFLGCFLQANINVIAFASCSQMQGLLHQYVAIHNVALRQGSLIKLPWLQQSRTKYTIFSFLPSSPPLWLLGTANSYYHTLLKYLPQKDKEKIVKVCLSHLVITKTKFRGKLLYWKTLIFQQLKQWTNWRCFLDLLLLL